MKYVLTPSMAAFRVGNRSVKIDKGMAIFAEVAKALKAGDFAKVKDMVKAPTKVSHDAEITDDGLVYRGMKLHERFAEAWVIAQEHGAGMDALVRFFDDLSKNPSPISVHAFSTFMAKSRMPITDRGTFLAYKRVDYGFRDHHTKTFDNRPGTVLRMPRESVDARQTQTCSTGFHVCSHTYLSHFNAGVDLVVEIRPRDVVAVPPDYQCSKMRLTEYRVLCTLPYFKKQLALRWQDALGMLPFFHTEQTKTWDVLEDVTNKAGINYVDPWAWAKA